jgi:hypothetical protein
MVDQVTIKATETTAEKPAETTTQNTEITTNTTTTPVAQDTKTEDQKILGKFKSQDDLIKSYQELEKQITKQNQSKTPNTKSELEIDQTANEVVASAGLNMDVLSNEYAENGSLSEKSIKSLEKIGISKDIVDSYIQGQQALSQQIETDIKAVVGGPQDYSNMMTWAKDSLAENEIAAYNRIVNGRDIDAIKVAVSGLKARMDKTQEPNLVRGKGSLGNENYESWAQVTSAMADPRYKKDTAYQAEVKNKLKNSRL